MTRAAALIVAAGRGERLGGDIPKGVRPLAGRPLALYALEAVEQTAEIGFAVVVVPEGYEALLKEAATRAGLQKLRHVVAGGASRRASVLRGLEAMDHRPAWTAVHDAARPFAGPRLFGAVIAAARAGGGAIAAAPAADTIKQARDLRILRTLDRSQLWHAQTPQVFATSELTDVLKKCAAAGHDVTDEAEAMERFGHPVTLVPNPELNLKISTPHDWRLAEYLLTHPPESST